MRNLGIGPRAQSHLEGRWRYNALKADRFASFTSPGSAEYQYPLLSLDKLVTWHTSHVPFSHYASKVFALTITHFVQISAFRPPLLKFANSRASRRLHVELKCCNSLVNSSKERGRVCLCKSKHALNEWHQRRSRGVNSKWSWCGCRPKQTIFLFLCFSFISLSPQLVIRSLLQVLFIHLGSVFIMYELSRLTCERSCCSPSVL